MGILPREISNTFRLGSAHGGLLCTLPERIEIGKRFPWKHRHLCTYKISYHHLYDGNNDLQWCEHDWYGMVSYCTAAVTVNFFMTNSAASSLLPHKHMQYFAFSKRARKFLCEFLFILLCTG